MNILVACEFSGAVRDAFIKEGHDAVSCDILPSDTPGPHYEGDVFDILDDGWDLMIAHPPCTYLCNSGVSWLYKTPKNNPTQDRWADMREGAEFFKALLDAPIPRKCIENPIMHKYAVEIIGRRQDQIIQPWQHGHPEQKSTCLWLENLPKLESTDILNGPHINRLHRLGPSADRGKERSKTYPGIAAAMATQWSKL